MQHPPQSDINFLELESGIAARKSVSIPLPYHVKRSILEQWDQEWSDDFNCITE